MVDRVAITTPVDATSPLRPTSAYRIPALGRLYDRLRDLPWLIVRVMYGFFFIPHGAQKLFGWFGGAGLQRTAEGFAHIGLEPGVLWATYIGCLELIGGILIVVGLFTRPVAVLFIGFMLAAAVHFNVPNGYFWTKAGIEVPILLTALAVAIAIGGGGPYSLDRRLGREF